MFKLFTRTEYYNTWLTSLCSGGESLPVTQTGGQWAGSGRGRPGQAAPSSSRAWWRSVSCQCCPCCGQLVIVTRVSGSRHLNNDRGRHLQAGAAQAAAPALAPAQTRLRQRHSLPGLSSLSSGVSSLLSRQDVSPSASCIHYNSGW